ncbi:MAG: T9SS type A sorting domain-containing protein [Saprospiraceae bacterium]|nr:T9SS type A sorting domain-containing protein [Saprospiraceae bacterium]
MKNTLIIVTSMLLCNGLLAQNWFQDDQVWYYQVNSGFSFTQGINEMRVGGDTIIDDQTYKILESNFAGTSFTDSVFYSSQTFVYEVNDSVFIFNRAKGLRELYYNFNLSNDAQVNYDFNHGIVICADSVEYTLNDISYEQYGNQELKVQHFKFYEQHTLSEYFGERKAIERIGMNNCNFDFGIPHCQSEIGGMTLCAVWIDNEYIEIADCSLLSSVENISSSNQINVYPNPTSNYINIQTQDVIHDLKIYDMHGTSHLLNRNTTTIDMSDFSSGLYILELKTDTGIEFHKVIKN